MFFYQITDNTNIIRKYVYLSLSQNAVDGQKHNQMPKSAVPTILNCKCTTLIYMERIICQNSELIFTKTGCICETLDWTILLLTANMLKITERSLCSILFCSIFPGLGLTNAFYEGAPSTLDLNHNFTTTSKPAPKKPIWTMCCY